MSSPGSGNSVLFDSRIMHRARSLMFIGPYEPGEFFASVAYLTFHILENGFELLVFQMKFFMADIVKLFGFRGE